MKRLDPWALAIELVVLAALVIVLTATGWMR